MLQAVILLIVGLVLIVLGADWLVSGASGIARKLGISEFVIGLTIVGFGTSCPELVVSLTGALEGISDISIGNVLGSNIFNSLLILGVTAIMMPIAITKANKNIDIPIVLAITIFFIVTGITNSRISRIEGTVYLILFMAYLYYCFKTGKEDNAADGDIQPLPKSIVLVLAGLAALIFGGQWFVDNAQVIAKALGVSDKFIAITLLAGGTSLPELATCVVAAAKKKGQLALGNILGSNLFNILLILGLSSVVMPLSFSSIKMIDGITLILSSLCLLVFCFTGTKGKIDRPEGALMVALWFAYLIWLLFNSSVTTP